MTAIPSYSTGTATVATDGTVVTGVTTLWGTGNIKPGDLFQSGHFCSFITDVTDDTHVSILPWGGGALGGAAYAIWKVSAQRMAGSDVWDDVDRIVASLNDAGYMVFVRSTLAAPDPSLGSEGQYAFQPSTGAYWQMTGGVWVPSGGPVKGYGGTSTTSLAIGTGAKAFATQGGLAYDGARVRASVGTDPTKWMEGVATYAGTTLTITVDLTNGAGTFASWKFAVSGQPGNMQNSDNLSGLTDKQAARGNLGILSHPQGRLTLVSGTPVMTTSQAGKTTLFYALATGNQAPLYDGTKFTMTEFAELLVATTDTTKNPAAIGASKVNDWFIWNDAGTLRLSHGPDWTSDTARSAGTALVKVNGIWLNNAAIANGPGAQRGTYVGTTRSDASSQLNFVLGASGQAAILAVWNAYNRTIVATTSSESTASWTYSSATVRASNGGANARVQFVSGLAEDFIPALVTQGLNLAAGAGSFAQFGMKMDATNAFDRYSDPGGIVGSVAQLQGLAVPNMYPPQLGYHFVSVCEAGDGTTTTTFTGGGKHGISLTLRM